MTFLNHVLFFFFFAAEQPSKSSWDIVLLIIQVSAAVALSFFAYYVVRRIKASRYDEAVSLQEIFRQFKNAYEDGEISDEEYHHIRHKMSAEIVTQIKSQKSETSSAGMSPDFKPLKK
ncbi:MAG: hypothetical protein LBQ54_11630 [Planctomycetaceae bacterium]|jgi:hypothetical protein|nr:hypothetical protein [Planctomycetaceae bacterium]